MFFFIVFGGKGEKLLIKNIIKTNYYIVGISSPNNDPALEKFKNQLFHTSEFEHPDVDLGTHFDENQIQIAFENQRSSIK